jgi:hypothetical protein
MFQSNPAIFIFEWIFPKDIEDVRGMEGVKFIGKAYPAVWLVRETETLYNASML